MTGKIQKIELNFVFWQVKSNKFISICVLTRKIQQIDLNFCSDMKIQINLFEFVFWQRKSILSILTGYLSYFFKSNLLFDRKNPENIVEFCVWQVKSNKFISMCVLTGEIQQIDLSFCFDMKIQINLFEFVFWQRKSIWSIFTCYLLHFFKSICFFDRKNLEIEWNFVFWLIKSNEFICICVLTGKIQQIDLNFGSDMKIQTNLFEFWFIPRESIWLIITGYLLNFFKSNLLFVFWQVKSNKFICICVLTGKIQQIDLNFCFDMKIQMNLFGFVFWQR